MGIDFSYYRDILIPWTKFIAARWVFYYWNERDIYDVQEFSREFDIHGFSLREW